MDPSPAYGETVEEIMKIYKSLPPRPSIEDVEAALSVINTVEEQERLLLEEISNQEGPQNVLPDLFSVLQQVKKNRVLFQSYEQRKEAVHLVELDRIFEVFDGLIQKASGFVSGNVRVEGQRNSTDVIEIDEVEAENAVISDENLTIRKNIGKADREFSKNADDFKGFSTKATISPSGRGDAEKLSMIQVAAIFEDFVKTGASILDLHGKLVEKVEWLPLSLGKLSTVTELNLSENRIMALPNTIGDLKSLKKFYIAANQLINLPDSFGELHNLTDLNLCANMLKSLPKTFGNLKNLINLDLSSNKFVKLPNIVGDLSFLQRLNMQLNDLEELPHTIGSCSSLLELRLDFNQLRALPEAIGKLECLKILTLHYNRVKGLPTTMGKLSHLKELDVSFNELESIPESLCFAVSLEKLNIGKNFADLRTLPECIGNLEMLEELDISDNQIKSLPNSFRSLRRLRIFRADQTPLEVPPMQITKLGVQVRCLT
ncbi:plant intracellular Ras-group-related LRR 5-like [Olea europaea subsp. europaea]|uniref:Plant intracellular Ras-group-related LRR 5-like n=1 Tax=Olea europaea subsp. europaea TaxID=158383 RepID=A0A8S0V7L2_OLEEU|nr:plant intracellular Ras-group-related LRR 5-like [Olea europaea subsp. europaea]